MGLLMVIGYYTAYFDSAISPWTTLGPLAIVVFLSMAQEGVADLSRHNSDRRTNQFLCTIVSRRTWVSPTSDDAKKRDAKRLKRERRSRRSRGKVKLPDEFSEQVSVFLNHQNTHPAVAGAAIADVEAGAESSAAAMQAIIEFHSVKRKDILPGQLVLVRNRDMIPCDIVLLASSGDNGGAYIETSGIDGETNLKLRNAAKAPPRSTAAAVVNSPSPKSSTLSPRFSKLSSAVVRTSFSVEAPAVINDHLTSTNAAEQVEQVEVKVTDGNGEETLNNDNQEDAAPTIGSPHSHSHSSSAAPSSPESGGGGSLRSSLRSPSKYSPSAEERRNQQPQQSSSSSPTSPSAATATSAEFQTPPSSPTRSLASKKSSSPKKNKHNNVVVVEPAAAAVSLSTNTVSSSPPSSKVETLNEATTRLANTTVLGHPNGQSCLGLASSESPPGVAGATATAIRHASATSNGGEGGGAAGLRAKFQHMKKEGHDQFESIKHTFAGSAERGLSSKALSSSNVNNINEPYVAMLTSELPNASVHTFSGKLTLPSHHDGDGDVGGNTEGQLDCSVEVPLNAENFLLRGAFLRNTEWAIGVAVFTGKDSKLVKNSSAAPSRLSQLDELV
jgi:hypothetical protein